jgi:hypothetical protein
MKLMTKYQIPVINNCLEKCDEKYLGTDGRKTVYPPPVEWADRPFSALPSRNGVNDRRSFQQDHHYLGTNC